MRLKYVATSKSTHTFVMEVRKNQKTYMKMVIVSFFLQHLELLQERFALYESLIQKYFCMGINIVYFCWRQYLERHFIDFVSKN